MVQSLNDGENGSNGSKICLLLLTSRTKRGKALFLLYYAEEKVCDFFETLPQSGDDFETAKEKLTEYFDPEKNVEYETCNFQQAKQNPW